MTIENGDESFDSIYDLSFDFNDGTIMVYDTLNDMYTVITPEQFDALVFAHFPDSAHAQDIRIRLFSGSKLRISFSTSQAAVPPPATYDFSGMVLSQMHATKSLKFNSKEEQRDYFLAQFGARVH